MDSGDPSPLNPDVGSGLIATRDRLLSSTFPPQPTRLIDRQAELARLTSLLSAQDLRLLTLTGPGGVGKTRLAVAAAEQVREQFPGGTWFVDLTSLVDPVLVVPTIARVVGVHERPGQTLVETLSAFFHHRVCLLLLDNFEHLQRAAATLEMLLAACPGLTLLVTSREPLQLRRERVVEVLPLPVPSTSRAAWTVADLRAVPAIEFYVERAQAADSSFVLSPENVTAVAELSRRLDGLPLAMELAAARTRFLTPGALLGRMEHNLAVLHWNAPDLPPRHRTLRATLDWSYALLTPAEQAVFRRLGIFAGGFTLEALAAVAATDELGVEPLELVQGLVDKHLVRVLDSASEEPRFGPLVTVRDYALEQLEATNEVEPVRDRHLAYYLDLAEQADGAMRGPDEERWLRQLNGELDNLRLAQEWAIARGDVETEWRLVAALALFWAFRGYLREGTQRIAAALSRSHPANPALRARILMGAGTLAEWSGDNEGAVTHFEGSVVAAEAAGETALAARARSRVAAAAYARGNIAHAHALIAEALAQSRAANSGWMIGYVFNYRILFAIGPHGSPREREQLRAELDEPETLLREAGDGRGLALLLAGRARLLVAVDPAAALAALREALELARGRGEPVVISIVPWLATVLLAERLPAEQVVRLGSGVAAVAARVVATGGRTMIDIFGAPHDRAVLEQAIASARETLGEVAFASADAAGRALAFDEILAELLAALETGEDVLATWTRSASPSRQIDRLLSPREREVLALVAEGRSNKQIAEALFVAPSTVKTHVASLLTKLNAENRSQLATIAVQRELLSDQADKSTG